MVGTVFTRFIDGRHKLQRVWRYAVTSVVATVASEATLLIVYGTGALGASASAVVASLAGTFPSYAMSRYWIWPEADRGHSARQATAYWLIALVSLVLSSAATGAAAHLAPAGRAAQQSSASLSSACMAHFGWPNSRSTKESCSGLLSRTSKEPSAKRRLRR